MPTLTFSETGSGTGVRQDIDVIGSGHVIRSDAYPDFGGKDELPSPLAYVLAALSSCTQVTAAIVTKEDGIHIDSYAFAIDGDFDPTVMVSGRQTDERHSDTFSAVRLAITVDTDATQEQIDRFAREVARRCPVSALFRRAGSVVTSTWIVAATADH